MMRFFRSFLRCNSRALPVATFVLAVAIFCQSPVPLFAQPIAGFPGYQPAVGGISIKSDGIIENASRDTLGRLKAERTRWLKKTPSHLDSAVPLRMVSLRRLDEAVETCLKSGQPLSEEILLLAGLQDIRFVFVYPEQKDIVLAGFGEGWRLDARGNLVGVTTGKPVLLLDDLLTALRTAGNSAREGMSCSIDPTAEGIEQFRAYTASLRTMNDKKAISARLEQALGHQRITFTGVAATSHFAHVLVAADYRMKRLAMAFDPSPVKGLPSFLQMYKATSVGMDNALQRWWLEPKYDAVLRSPDGLAWEFSGATVKCMTEEDCALAGGEREHSGKSNAVAQKWADAMTAHYDELSLAEPIFGELRNCMQLALVGALVAHERFIDKAGCHLPSLMQDSVLKTEALPAPTHVESRVSMLKQGRNWIISASGGVAIRPGLLVNKARQSATPGQARAKSANAGKSGWYWN
jgi:hypothetical protein